MKWSFGNQRFNLFDYLGGHAHVIAVRLGWWKSPSLALAQLNPRDFKAHVEPDGGVNWIRRAGKKMGLKKFEVKVEVDAVGPDPLFIKKVGSDADTRGEPSALEFIVSCGEYSESLVIPVSPADIRRIDEARRRAMLANW